jgi:hypothetical protein
MRTQKFFGRLILGLMVLAYGIAQFLGERFLIGVLDALPPVCPMRMILNLKCSFCGMTHAFLYLFFGEFREAFHENVLSIPLFFGILVGAGAASLGRFPDYKFEQRRRFLILGLCALTGYTMLRNLP